MRKFLSVKAVWILVGALCLFYRAGLPPVQAQETLEQEILHPEATAGEVKAEEKEVPAFQHGRDHKEALMIDGKKRTFVIHLPYEDLSKQVSDLSWQGPSLPLVLVLHGAKEPRAISELTTGFDKIADAENFIVVYPNTEHQQWNDGRLAIDTPAHNYNDVKFLTTLIDHMIATYGVNPKQVYITGYSSGGMMSMKMGMEVTDKLAAIAPVSSSIPLPQYKLNLKPSRPLPVMMMNGTQDPAFPWNGGDTTILGIKVGEVLPVEKTLDYWLTANGGPAAPPEIRQSTTEKNDGTHVEVFYYNTKDQVPVVLFKVVGGGHTWPGGHIPLNTIPILGKESKNLSASEIIWEFFKHNPRQ